jgi:hypothetical protein
MCSSRSSVTSCMSRRSHPERVCGIAIVWTRQYGGGKWRKMKGIATVELSDGTICEAELHWYEAHGVGKKELKFKKPVRGG